MTKLVGFFIDDLRNLEIHPYLEKVDIEWHVFRNLRSFVNSDVYNKVKADYISFDFYLDGSVRGTDFIFQILHDYKEKNWDLPIASFHSSDKSRNDLMQELWESHGGRSLENLKPVTEVVINKPLSSVAKHFRRNKK